MVLKIAMLFNGVVGVSARHTDRALSLLSRDARGRKPGYESWISLGSVDQFPAGQTRLATYRNPIANASDGETADIPCWVRNVDGNTLPGIRDQLRAPGLSRAMVSAIATLHVSLPRRSLLRGRRARIGSAGAGLVRISDSRFSTENFRSRRARCRRPAFPPQTRPSSR